MTKHKPLEWRESLPPAECPYDPDVQGGKDGEFHEPPYRLAGLAAAVFWRLSNGYWSNGDATAPHGDVTPLDTTTWPDMDTRGAV